MYDPATAVLTQYDDAADGPRNPTSSLSAPNIVLDFLELLHPLTQQRVLEVAGYAS